MGLSRPTAMTVIFTATSTGVKGEVMDLGVGHSALSAAYVFTGSTKAMSFVLQASIGASGAWKNMTAATTMSTGASGGFANSTGALTFDKARVFVTTNDTTGNATVTFSIIAR